MIILRIMYNINRKHEQMYSNIIICHHLRSSSSSSKRTDSTDSFDSLSPSLPIDYHSWKVF